LYAAIEMTAVDFAQRLLVHRGVVVGAAVFDVVGGEVLRAGGDVGLQPRRQCRRHAAEMKHVFAVGLLSAAPVRVSQDVHARRKQHAVIGGHSFVRDRFADLILELEIERGSAGGGHGEQRRVICRRLPLHLRSGQVQAAPRVTIEIAADDRAIQQL
jgi:hypothetical protein